MIYIRNYVDMLICVVVLFDRMAGKISGLVMGNLQSCFYVTGIGINLSIAQQLILWTIQLLNFTK